MYKITISGGPHSGKSTLQKQLGQRYPEAHLVPEPATEVIEKELGKLKIDDSYIPTVPWIDYAKFGPLVIRKSLELEDQIPQDTELVFLDRCLIDTIAYATFEGCPDIATKATKLAHAANYTVALFCEPVSMYTPTEVRREDDEKARQIHSALKETYIDFGIPMIHIPDIALAERYFIVREALSDLDLSLGDHSIV